MACYHPVPAFRDPQGGVSFSGFVKPNFHVPCGRCVGCRLERSRQWATRCWHEASLHTHNEYVTLTYSDEHIPEARSLRYRDFQLFMKRLRRRGYSARFFMCGEYGERSARPHYHACLFGVRFPDRKFHKMKGKFKLFISDELDELWGLGDCVTGDVSFESAAYVARYILKKITGDLAADHYAVVDVSTGEIFQREPEFCHMSLKPGIGAGWLEKFHSDVYPHGKVVVRGHESPPPKYYDKKFKLVDPESWLVMKREREAEALLRSADSTPERLAVREVVAKARTSQYPREG